MGHRGHGGWGVEGMEWAQDPWSMGAMGVRGWAMGPLTRGQEHGSERRWGHGTMKGSHGRGAERVAERLVPFCELTRSRCMGPWDH